MGLSASLDLRSTWWVAASLVGGALGAVFYRELRSVQRALYTLMSSGALGAHTEGWRAPPALLLFFLPDTLLVGLTFYSLLIVRYKQAIHHFIFFLFFSSFFLGGGLSLLKHYSM